MDITINHYLLLSAFVFSIGVIGVLTRRNVLIIFMSVELMLNSANLALITFSHYMQNIDGMVFVFFSMTVAAAEVGVGLAIIITLFRNLKTVDVGDFNLLRG